MQAEDPSATELLPIASDPGPPTHRAGFGAWREAGDMRQRTRVGGVFYVLAWALCWGFGPAPGEQLLLGAAGLAVFGALLAARLAHRLPANADELPLRRWASDHWRLVLATAGAWGMAAAWAVLQPEPHSSRLIAIVATVAFSTAMVHTFPMDPRRALLGVVLLLLPAIGALVRVGRPQLPVLLTLAFYGLYLVLALRRSHGDYARHTDLAFELIEQRERFRALSRTDALTRLGNRLQFNAVLPVLAAQARRHGTPLSLAMFDIDFFKRVNDGWGHAAGDACLVVFAGLMRQTFRRDGDVLVRLGGEEFGVLMPDTPLEQAWQRAESFRRLVAASPVPWRDRHIALTSSGGVSAYVPVADADPEQLVQRVDRALYAAKAGGRDRVILGEAPVAPPASSGRTTSPGRL